MPFLEKLKSKVATDYPSEKAPEYTATATGSTEAPPPLYAVDDPITSSRIAELNAAFTSLNLDTKPPKFPEPDYCLAHLKLLAAFHALKKEVGYSDGLFGIEDSRTEKTENRGDALAAVREKRWTLFVTRAAERFQDWWLKVLVPREHGERITCDQLANDITTLIFSKRGTAQAWTTDMLPPLDVLMVWHTFQLNPRNYYEDCIKYGLKDLWATGLPWAAINKAIDTDFSYNVSDQGQADFVALTGRSWENGDDSLTKSVQCPRCNRNNEVPWTTLGVGGIIDFKTMKGTGYGDRDFSYDCTSCSRPITHDLLFVNKFKKDAEGLLLNDYPLGGTILSWDGTIATKNDSAAFVNRLVKNELRSKILTLIDTEQNPTVNDVKKLIETSIQDKSIVRSAYDSTWTKGSIRRREGTAIRKMMKKYWDNSSIFALELGSAVIRQSLFVDKMQGLDWLHSPSAVETMKRLLTKYDRFLDLMVAWPQKTLVPTLDIDLAWHTHQLSPQQYYDYTMAKTKKFVDHDDKISEDNINEYFEWTSQVYQSTFKEVYSECTCWYCEAIRARHVEGKVFGASKIEKPAEDWHASGAAELCQPDKSAHISTHNVVRIEETAVRASYFNRIRDSQRHQIDVAYAAACRKAKKKGRKEPDRKDYYHNHWGAHYVVALPFLAVPVVVGGLYFAGDTSSMPEGIGMPGACVAGACSAAASSDSNAMAYGGAGGVAGCGGGGGCGGGCGGGGS